MSRRPSRSQPVQPQPQVTPEELRQGVGRLGKCLDKVKAFHPTSVTEQNNIPHVEALGAMVDVGAHPNVRSRHSRLQSIF